MQGYVYAAKLAASRLSDMLGNREKCQHFGICRRNSFALSLKKLSGANTLSTYALALDGQKSRAACEHRTRVIACIQESSAADRGRTVAETLHASGFFQWMGRSHVSPPDKLVTIRFLTTMVPSGHMTTPLLRAAWQDTDAKIWRGKILLGSARCQQVGGPWTSPGVVLRARRHRGEGPTLYPVACSPQAWAAEPFLLVQSCLGVSIHGTGEWILFDRPYLPQGIPQLWIEGLRCGTGSVDLLVERRNDAVEVEVVDRQGEVEVVIAPSADALELS